VQNTTHYTASPFKALQGFVELETKQKRKEEMVKTAASSAQAALAVAAAAKPAVVPPVQSSKTNDLPLSAQQNETDNGNSEFDNIVVPEEEQLFSEEDNSPKEAKLPLAKLRSLVFDHLLEIINSGNYEQLTSLKGIGKVRAMKIFTIRNAGSAFECVDDLEAVGMNNKQIEKFVKENVGLMLGNY
jgi:DNA uptake protein ComE-like DNA-binding protein